MKVQVEELSPIERKLSIEVDAEQVNDELSRAYNQLGRQVKIDGFRPGKVPRRILEQRFRAQVEDDVVQRVVERAYFSAIVEHKVDAVSNPEVKNDRLKPNAPFSFEARVEVKPKVDPKDYKQLPLKKVDRAVSEDKVNGRIEDMRSRMATLEPLEGRDTVQPKDYVVVDYEGAREGQPFPGSKAENITVEVAPGELVESNIEALAGAKLGETRELDYTFPAEYAVTELRGQTAHFKVHVKGLKQQVTPELNDDFAKEIGGGNTLDELKAKVRKDLEASANQTADQDEREAVLKALVEKNPVEVPKAMVERAVDMMLDGALRSLARGGIDPRRLSLDFNRLREDMREKAKLEVQGSLLMEGVALKENIAATDDEVNARIEKVASESGAQAPQVRAHFRKPEERRGLSLRIREEKTVEFLKGQAALG